MTPPIIGWSHLRFGKREDTLQEMMAAPQSVTEIADDRAPAPAHPRAR